MPTSPQGLKAGFKASWKDFLIIHLPPMWEAERDRAAGPGLAGAVHDGVGGVSRTEQAKKGPWAPQRVNLVSPESSLNDSKKGK